MRGVIFKCFPKTAFNEEQCRFTTKSKSIKKTLPIVASHQQTPGNILSYSLQRALCVYNLMLQTNLLFFFFFHSGISVVSFLLWSFVSTFAIKKMSFPHSRLLPGDRVSWGCWWSLRKRWCGQFRPGSFGPLEFFYFASTNQHQPEAVGLRMLLYCKSILIC